MALTLQDAAAYDGRDAVRGLTELLMPPRDEQVAHDDDWSYAVAGEQKVGKLHAWAIRDERFVASGSWFEDEPDVEARAALAALIASWKAAGHEDYLYALNPEEGEDGLDWSRLSTTREVPFSIDVPLAQVTFYRAWYDRPMKLVAYSGPAGIDHVVERAW
jgi:hypothetical protein